MSCLSLAVRPYNTAENIAERLSSSVEAETRNCMYDGQAWVPVLLRVR